MRCKRLKIFSEQLTKKNISREIKLTLTWNCFISKGKIAFPLLQLVSVFESFVHSIKLWLLSKLTSTLSRTRSRSLEVSNLRSKYSQFKPLASYVQRWSLCSNCLTNFWWSRSKWTGAEEFEFPSPLFCFPLIREYQVKENSYRKKPVCKI